MREQSIRDTFGENDTNAYLKNPESFRQAQATSAGNTPAALRGAGASQGVMSEEEYLLSKGVQPDGRVAGMSLDSYGRMRDFSSNAASQANEGLEYLKLHPAARARFIHNKKANQLNLQKARQRALGLTPADLKLELEAERNVLRAGMKPNFTPKQQQMMMEVDALRRGIPQNATGMIPLNRREVYELERQHGPSIGQRILSGSNFDPATRQRNKQINRPTVGRRR
jgi:hypothetical protein